MQQHCSKYFASRPPLPPDRWDQNSTFSEHGHVTYQLKGNHKRNNMVANILPADSSRLWGQNSTLFRTWSCCISNKRESHMQHHCSKYFASRPSLSPPGHGDQNSTFSESQMQQHGSK